MPDNHGLPTSHESSASTRGETSGVNTFRVHFSFNERELVAFGVSSSNTKELWLVFSVFLMFAVAELAQSLWPILQTL